jgi:hypothetical protein
MKEAGRITLSDPEKDKPLLEVATLQCCHCGKHWAPRPGSGIIRGFCTRCMGPVCGPGCAKCVSIEQELENMEKGRPLDYRPIISRGS